MRERSLRRAVYSTPIVESVELRRLLSIAPDATFGTAGIVHFTDGLPATSQYDQIVTAQGAGGFTTVAETSDSNTTSENLLIVRRFNTSGAPIGSPGTVTLPLSPSDPVTVTDVVVDSSNNAYVAGYFSVPTGFRGFVARITAGGTLDTNFDGDGVFLLPKLASNASSVQLIPSSTGVYATFVTSTPTLREANIVALKADGTFDLNYDVNGLGSVAFSLPNFGGTVDEVVVDGTGLQLIGQVSDASNNVSIYVARVTATGLLDTSFGTNGFGVSGQTGLTNLTISGVARVGGGYAVAGYDFNGVESLIKLGANFALDTSFGGTGVITPPVEFVLGAGGVRGLAVDASGKLYVAGGTLTVDPNNPADLTVIRLTAAGTLDTSFDGDGVYTLNEAFYDSAFGIELTAAGALLAVGSQIDGTTLLPSGVLVQLAEPPVVNSPSVVAAVSGPASVNTGVSANFSSSFSDVDAADTFTVAWNFGDGNTLAPVATSQGAVTASHAYAVAGTYTVTVTVADSAGHVVSNTGTIVVNTVPPVLPYTIVGGQLSLTTGSGNDTIELVRSGVNRILTVNGTPYTITTPITSAIINGGGGNDFIRVSSQLTIPVTLIGGSGHDTLRGGSGNDVIVGDDGNDILIGRDGQDLMIGGTGADFLIGREDSDILISGTTSLSSNLAALGAIMAEWTSSHNLLVKLANVTGLLPQSGRLNGNFYLTPNVNVFGDNSIDTLSGGDGSDLYYVTLCGLNGDVIHDNLNSFAPSIAILVFGD